MMFINEHAMTRKEMPPFLRMRKRHTMISSESLGVDEVGTQENFDLRKSNTNLNSGRVMELEHGLQKA